MIVLKLVQVYCVCVHHSIVLSFADGSCTRQNTFFGHSEPFCTWFFPSFLKFLLLKTEAVS